MRLALVACLLVSLTASAKEDVDAAREHYKSGTKLFDLGKYIEAAREYEAAYEAKDDPSLLFNIGQSYRLAGEKDPALRAYKSYLRRSPQAGNRVAVEGRIDELQKAIEQEQKTKQGPPEGVVRPASIPPKTDEPPPSTAQPAPPVEKTERTPVYKKWWLWTVVAVVVVAGVGVGVGVGLTSGPRSFDPTVKDIGPGAKALTVKW